MNCPEAERLLFAERDGALDESQRAALATHLAQCAACREAQNELASSAAAWRRRDATIATPDIEREWHAIRRRIRQADTPVSWLVGWRKPVWWSAASALAAIALAVFLGPRWFGATDATPERDWAYVSYVVVENPTESTMVYEDQQSGWLVVWVGDPSAEASGT